MGLAAAVARAFDLGDPSGPATAVDGGLLNRMWRVDTSTGAYAVKQPAHTHVVARGDYQRAFDVELAALDAGLAIPRPVPNPHDGGPLADLAVAGPSDVPVTVLVHRWVDGRRLDPDVPVSPEVARAVAHDLARLNGLGIDPTRWPDSGVWKQAPTPATWTTLATQVGDAGIDLGWSRALVDHEAQLRALAERLLVEDGPIGPTVVSHRDADAKNLLIVDGRAMLIDWEVCGPTTVGHELGKSVLDLAGGCQGPPLEATAVALLAGYAEVAGRLPEPSGAWFSEWFMACSSFVAYNVGLARSDAADHGVDDRPSQILSTLLPALIDTATRWDDLTRQLADLVSAAQGREVRSPTGSRRPPAPGRRSP